MRGDVVPGRSDNCRSGRPIDRGRRSYELCRRGRTRAAGRRARRAGRLGGLPDPSPTFGPVKPGMTATVQVVVEHADGVVSLPTSAVTAGGTTVTVKVEVGTDPKKTTPTQITLGLRGDSSIEIVSGLAAGRNVVVTCQTTTTGTGTIVGGAGWPRWRRWRCRNRWRRRSVADMSPPPRSHRIDLRCDLPASDWSGGRHQGDTSRRTPWWRLPVSRRQAP